ncbi:hypothetical protein [Paenibacillus xylanilyticus]|uniref:hypothetical protein n=1 Tax=Paenibacillus xylanilyticus TaxID=248903 RepID=UPI00399FE969
MKIGCGNGQSLRYHGERKAAVLWGWIICSMKGSRRSSTCCRWEKKPLPCRCSGRLGQESYGYG